MTSVFVTHDRMEALRLATRLGVMRAGEILQVGSPDEVMNHPVNEFVASLVGVENLLQGRVTRRNEGLFIASVSGRDIEAMGSMEPGDLVVLCLRPENITLSPVTSEGTRPEGNTLSATVVKITPMGFFQKVQLNCGFPLVTYVANTSFSELSLKEGAEVLASFKARAVHAIRGSSGSLLTETKSRGSSRQDTGAGL